MVNLPRYNFIYPFVLKAIGCLGDVREGKKVRGFVVKTGTGFEAYMCKSLIDMYPEMGMVESFWQALDEMPERNRLCWNVTILGYVRCRRFEDALDMFWRMRCESMEKPDEVTVASTLSACTELKNLLLGKKFMTTLEYGVWLWKLCRVDEAIERSLSSRAVLSWEHWSKSTVTKIGRAIGLNCLGSRIAAVAEKKIGGDLGSMIPVGLPYQFKPRPEPAGNGQLPSATSAADSPPRASQQAERLPFVIFFATGLMEMYAKWGSIDKSLEIFNGLGTKKQPLGFQSFVGLQCKEWQDKLSNRVVLENGTDWHEACDLTFIAVLTARVHRGLLD
ncbi:hypothetical protein ACFX15_017138 [Malus domestica]